MFRETDWRSKHESSVGTEDTDAIIGNERSNCEDWLKDGPKLILWSNEMVVKGRPKGVSKQILLPSLCKRHPGKPEKCVISFNKVIVSMYVTKYAEYMIVIVIRMSRNMHA